MSKRRTTSPRSLTIWFVGVSFVLFQFFMQLSSGVVIGAIMHEMNLTALTAGFLGSSLYVVYTAMQIPVGILFDRKNTRLLLTGNALLCSLGCLVFARSHQLMGLFGGRLLIGLGSSFAFVGFSHILRQHFPLRRFGFLIGLSETLAFVVTVIGMITLGDLITHSGWRLFVGSAGVIGFFISFLTWHYIPDSKTTHKQVLHYGMLVRQLLVNRTAWINGLYIGFSFSLVTVFGALWAIPFIQVKLVCSLAEASRLGAMFFLGAGVSCPLFGALAGYFPKRLPLILASCLSTTLLLLVILYVPMQPLTLGILLFTIGCTCGAYMLAFTIANEIAPPGSLSLAAGFTNTLAMITAPTLQPLVGYLLDLFGEHGSYSLSDYQNALLIMPLCLVLASVLVLFLPEKNR